MPFSAAANTSSDYMTLRTPPVQGTDTSVMAVRFPIQLLAADLANGIVGALGILPAGHVPVGFEVDAAQLDSNGAPALAYSVGVLNAAQSAIDTSADCGGAAWATGLTTGRTAGGSASGLIASRPLKKCTQRQTDRLIGIAITGGAATPVAGELAITLWYRPA